MDLLGPSLADLQVRMPEEKFSVGTALRIGLQMIDVGSLICFVTFLIGPIFSILFRLLRLFTHFSSFIETSNQQIWQLDTSCHVESISLIWV